MDFFYGGYVMKLSCKYLFYAVLFLILGEVHAAQQQAAQAVVNPVAAISTHDGQLVVTNISMQVIQRSTLLNHKLPAAVNNVVAVTLPNHDPFNNAAYRTCVTRLFQALNRAGLQNPVNFKTALLRELILLENSRAENKAPTSKNPKKRSLERLYTAQVINPDEAFKFVQLSIALQFTPEIQQGCMRYYALALLSNIREMKDEETEERFMQLNDCDLVPGIMKTGYLDASKNAIRDNINHEYLYLTSRWFDGKAPIIQNAQVWDEVGHLIQHRMIPDHKQANPDAGVDRVKFLAQWYADHIIAHTKSAFSFRRYSLAWITFLPAQLQQEISKQHLIKRGELLPNMPLEELDGKEWEALQQQKRVPPFGGDIELKEADKAKLSRTIARRYAQWYTREHGLLWGLHDENYCTSAWLQQLPKTFQDHVAIYVRGMFLKNNCDRWLNGRVIEIPEEPYLLDFVEMGILQKPPAMQDLKGVQLNSIAQGYARDLKIDGNWGQIKTLMKKFPPAFGKRIIINLWIRSNFDDRLIQKAKDVGFGEWGVALPELCAHDDFITKSVKAHGSKLDFSGQYLKTISQRDLNIPGVDLKKVVELDLSHNNLTRLPDDLFANLPGLRKINLAHNNLTQLPDRIFLIHHHDKHFELIDLGHNKITPAGFAQMHNLTVDTLIITDNDLETLPEGKLPQRIAHFVANHNKLTLDTKVCAALHDMEHLMYLDLSHNRLTSLDKLMNCGLKHLVHFIATDNKGIKELRENKQGQIHALTLEIAELQARIKTVQVGDEQKAPGHRTARLETKLPIFIALRTLDLAGCDIKALRPGDFDTFPQLQRLHLEHNAISEMVMNQDLSPFSSLTELKELCLQGNALTEIPVRIFSNLKKLEMLDIAGNQLTKLDPDTFVGLERLQELYLYFNHPGLRIIPGAFNGLTRVSYLDLSYNGIGAICSDMWQGLTTITHLNLAHNALKHLPRAFENHNTITHLDLSGNNLSTARWECLDDLEKLEVLKMKENNLYDWYIFKMLRCKGGGLRLGLPRRCTVDMERSKYWRLFGLSDAVSFVWRHKAGIVPLHGLLMHVLGCGMYKKIKPELLVSLCQYASKFAAKKNPGQIDEFYDDLRAGCRAAIFSHEKVKITKKG